MILANLSLMLYFAVVSLIGTFGNGIILLAYGNRWSSSRSTSVIFILVLACVDLWTCLIVVPTIAIMEHSDFEVPTPLCRFYSFSKILIIMSSLIMSFIALDRFLNIATPHHRLLNPWRVKCLLTTFISIGIGLGILTALAFASKPNRQFFTATYIILVNNSTSNYKTDSCEISITFEQRNSSSFDITKVIREQAVIPANEHITNISLSLTSISGRCFADTSIISDTTREVLRHISNKFFFISIGIVTILYTITFVLALHRQSPRIRALKKSLTVLNKFHSNSINYEQNSVQQQQLAQRNNSILSTYSALYKTGTGTLSIGERKCLKADDAQQYPMSSFTSNDDLNEKLALSEPQNCSREISSDIPSEDLRMSTEKISNIKQVSFQVENNNLIIDDNHEQLSFARNSFDMDSTDDISTYFKIQCPCWKSRQLLIKFHFPRPRHQTNYCLCCVQSGTSPLNDRQFSVISSVEEETTTILIPTTLDTHAQERQMSNSDVLKKQLYRQRLKQIRMALMFLLVTVSFVVFYLPSILNAERLIKSPLMIYYLYLCTHALNPIIYCFMNRSLRAYVFATLRCRRMRTENNAGSGGMTI